MHPLNVGIAYHSGEWCSSINLCFWRSSEAAFPVPGVTGFCSVTPVATHPFCEVTVIVIIIVHNDSRQQPERHDGVEQGSSWWSSSKCDPSRVVHRVKTPWAQLLNVWLTGCSTTQCCPTRQRSLTSFRSLCCLRDCWCSPVILGWTRNKLHSFYTRL